MKLIPIFLFLTIPFFGSGQKQFSNKTNTVAFDKQKFAGGIKRTTDEVAEHFLSAKYNLALTTKINSKVKCRKKNSAHRHTHRRESEVLVAMHFSLKKSSTFRD